MAKSGFCSWFDKSNAIVKIILVLFLDVIIGALYRIFKGKVLFGIIWLLTIGLFGIGWIIDIVTVILKGKITFLA